jgi:DNA-binding SARP family transcriptional activator/pimeloyl-ACP methyl ester carboxylesterase/class 3 adenylate cyclase
MEFHVLGPLQVTAGGRVLAIGGARTRAVLGLLLAEVNRVVPADRIAGQLWPDLDRDRAIANLQVRLAELRRALRSAGDAQASRLVTIAPGYRLLASADELDVLQFEQLVRAGREALRTGDPAAATRLLDAALALWRGPALADLGDLEFAAAERTRLEEARLAAVELRMEALLGAGRHPEAVAELEALTSSHPLRERFWAQRVLALYRCGRQADALRACRDLRKVLREQLGIDPGRELRDLETRILRQDSVLDFRPARPVPAGQVPAGHAAPPQTRYVESDGLHIAYQVIGAGERDIVLVPGLMSHLDLAWEDDETAEFFRRLSGLGRLILFDKRDTGLSDRSMRESSLEDRMDDVLAVMRAAGSRQAVLFGYSEGAPMSILFAATYPHAVSALVLGSAAARWPPAPDYPCGAGFQEMFTALEDIAAHSWGQGKSIEWYLPSQAGSAHARHLFGRFERMAVSPASFLRMIRMIREIDVRAVLPAIHTPTLVIQRLDDRITPPCYGRYLAAHIAGARYFEQPGDHSLRFAGGGDSDALFREIGEFLASGPGPVRADRVLATMLVTRAAGDGRSGPEGADARYRGGAAELIALYGGRTARSRSGVTMATFDAPGQAIRCAAALRDQARKLGIRLSAGIHAGEVDLAGGDVTGAAVDAAGSVLAVAGATEVLVSRTVRDLVVGSGIEFTDRGRHQLRGIDSAWHLFAVAGVPDAR